MGCDIESDTIPKIIDTSEINLSSINDQIAIKTAKGVHILMKNSEVRALIKKEANRQFDGDYNVLVMDLIRQPLTMNIGNGMRTNTFGAFLRQVLGEKNDDLSAISIQNTQHTLIDSIAQYYPLMQLAIPQLENMDINDWNHENN